jgi:hypothetical protein
MKPQYQDYSDKDLPRYVGDKFQTKVISGKAFGMEGPITPPTPIQYVHLFIILILLPNFRPFPVFIHSFFFLFFSFFFFSFS